MLAKNSYWFLMGMAALSAAVFAGCSSKSSPSPGMDAGSAGMGGTAGAGGKGGAGGKAGGAGKAGAGAACVIPPSMMCGSTECKVSDTASMACMTGMLMGSSLAAPCCLPDGMSCGSMISGKCEPPLPHDASCDLDLMGMKLAGCCTAMGMCGIDATSFGMGCFDISAIAMTTPKKCMGGGGDNDAGTGTEDGGN